MFLMVLPSLLSSCRGSPSPRTNCVAALPGGHFAECHDCHSVRDAVPAHLPARGVPGGEECPAHHLAQLQLHGPVAGAGAESEGEWPAILLLRCCGARGGGGPSGQRTAGQSRPPAADWQCRARDLRKVFEAQQDGRGRPECGRHRRNEDHRRRGR